MRQDLASYFGEAQAFDMALGVLVKELKKAGEFENTIIAISGDHGAPGFQHGVITIGLTRTIRLR